MAGDGASGIACVLRTHSDIALVDIGLPGTNGYDVARVIRKQGPNREIRQIALTGYGQAAAESEQLRA